MKILTLNSGSSSLKYEIIQMPDCIVLFKGFIDRITFEKSKVILTIDKSKLEYEQVLGNHNNAINHAFNTLIEHKIVGHLDEIGAIGHRVVHGGEHYDKAVLIDDKVINVITSLEELAPLHNPPNLMGIIACKNLLPSVRQVAIFDTAFHQTIPEKEFLYGIPIEEYKKLGVRKYGFHGTSHKYIYSEVCKLLGNNSAKVVCCHLGNGSSITAMKDGKSIDTSMGFTPLDGLIMGTRCGNIDPGVILFLMGKKCFNHKQMEMYLNKECGLKGLSGYSADVRDLRDRYFKGEKEAILVFEKLSHQIAKFVGSYFVALGGIDALIFTAGIGENAYYIRDLVCNELICLGVAIDKFKNEANELIISAENSKFKVMVIPTNEELMIAKETYELVK